MEEWLFLAPTLEERHRWMIPENPCVPWMRRIIEQLLAKEGMNYKEFHPQIRDREDVEQLSWWRRMPPLERFQWERQLSEIDRQQRHILQMLLPGLNRMSICTWRKEYFQEWEEYFGREHGLVIEYLNVQENDGKANWILDMTLWQQPGAYPVQGEIHYLPMYRRPWEICQNLDIIVPIGYNTVTVRDVVHVNEVPREDLRREHIFSGVV